MSVARPTVRCMPLFRLLRKLGSVVDAYDAFSMFLWMTGFSAFVSWAQMIVRAIRGEAVQQDWRTTYSAAAFIAALVVGSASKARGGAALGESLVEMRKLLREGAKDAEARDKRATVMQKQLYRVNVAMASLAGLTLLAAIVTLVVTIVAQR